MQRVIERSKAAAKSATVQPAVRWGGLLAIVAGVLIAAFALPKAQPKAQPVSLDSAPVLAADAALHDAIRAGNSLPISSGRCGCPRAMSQCAVLA